MKKIKLLNQTQLQKVYEEAKRRTEKALCGNKLILPSMLQITYMQYRDTFNFMLGLPQNCILLKELRKTQYIDNTNIDKIKFLMIREHFLSMREFACCTVNEVKSYDPKISGLYGEKLTLMELEFMKAKKYNGNILFDIYIPDGNGKYSQIDSLFVCSKGIFVIESKNYYGSIYGNENDYKWRGIGETKRHYEWEFYNPLKQNSSHINAIHYHLRGIPCFSLVVFPESCNLNQVFTKSKDIYVINRYAMLNVF